VRFGVSHFPCASVSWLGLAWLLAARDVPAQPSVVVEPPEGETLRYRAPEQCPGRASFEARSSDSLARLHAGDRLEVSLRSSEHGFRGELELVAMDSTIWNRGVSGKDCDEVVSALALSLAVFVDGFKEEPRPPEVELVAPSSPVSGIVDREPTPSAIAQTPLRWRFGVDAGGALRSGLGETVDPSLRLGVLASDGRDIGHHYRLGVEVGAAGMRALPPAFGDLRWDHRWWTVNFQACPWGVALSPWLTLEPCLAAHLGRYAAELVGERGRASWLALVDLGVRASLRWGRLAAGLELGGFVPVDPLGLERGGQVFFRQRPGVMVAVSLAYDVLELEK
jgi:hypothetical protein